MSVFSYYAVVSQDSNLSPPRRRASALRVEPRSRVIARRTDRGMDRHLIIFFFIDLINNRFTWITEILCHLYLLKTVTLVGLWTVAEGCVRNRVGNLKYNNNKILIKHETNIIKEKSNNSCYYGFESLVIEL